MIATKKCKWCGTAFQYMGNPICPKCQDTLDADYKVAREFLYDNPNATIEQVVEGTGIDERAIIYFLRDERLKMAHASGLLRCEQCGAPIETGRYCEKCGDRISKQLNGPGNDRQKLEKSAAQNMAGMHGMTGKDKMHMARRLEGDR